MARRPKASGRNIPEAERHTVAVKLRLPPDEAAALRELAAAAQVTVSELVVALMRRRR
jgi:hypothetical protein